MGLVAKSQDAQCQHPNCFERGWRGATYCQFHFIFATKVDISKTPIPWCSAVSRRALMENTRWTHKSRALDKISSRDGTKVVCLDLEYSATSRKTPLYHTELHKPASTKGSVHTDLYQIHTKVSQLLSRNVYGLNRSKCTGLRDAHFVAAQAREAGITPDTIILVWSSSYLDLTLLQEFFEEAGYGDILPSKENCIRMIPLYSQNLPKGCPLKLEILFPMIFQGHELVGTNHRALEDSLQLHLMAKLFQELCKPDKERDLPFLPDTNRSLLGQGKQGMVQQDLDGFVTRLYHKKSSEELQGPTKLNTLGDADSNEHAQEQYDTNFPMVTRRSLETDSSELLCGLYAIQHSIEYQHSINELEGLATQREIADRIISLTSELDVNHFGAGHVAAVVEAFVGSLRGGHFLE